MTVNRPEPQAAQVAAASAETIYSAASDPALYPQKAPGNLHYIVEYPETDRAHTCGGNPPAPPALASSPRTVALGGTQGVRVLNTTPTNGVPAPTTNTSAVPGFTGRPVDRRRASPSELAALRGPNARPKPNLEDPFTATPATDGSGRRLNQIGGLQQDILVLYSARAATSVGGVQMIYNLIRQNIARTNKAYADSAIDLVLNLVAIRQITYNDVGQGLGTVLSDLANNRVSGNTARVWRDEVSSRDARGWVHYHHLHTL